MQFSWAYIGGTSTAVQSNSIELPPYNVSIFVSKEAGWTYVVQGTTYKYRRAFHLSSDPPTDIEIEIGPPDVSSIFSRKDATGSYWGMASPSNCMQVQFVGHPLNELTNVAKARRCLRTRPSANASFTDRCETIKFED